MEIISKSPQTQTVITGRLSDGSDRQEITVNTYFVKIEDSDKFYMLSFSVDPTTEEIQAALDAGQGIEITTVEDLSAKLVDTRGRLALAEEALDFLIMGGI